MGRLLLVLAAAAAVCGAQELPAPMKRAVQSLSKKLLEKSFKEPVLIAGPKEPSKPCSVPLAGMRVDHLERYTLKVVPTDPSIDRKSRIEPPAPPCDSRRSESLFR
jgi:hypothetical protein